MGGSECVAPRYPCEHAQVGTHALHALELQRQPLRQGFQRPHIGHAAPRAEQPRGQIQQQLARARVRIEALEAREQDLVDACQELAEARKRIAELEGQNGANQAGELSAARTRIRELETRTDADLAGDLAAARARIQELETSADIERARIAELEAQGGQGSEVQAMEQLLSWRDAEIAELKAEVERARLEAPIPSGSPESARINELLGQLEAARQAAADNRAALEAATVRTAAIEHELRAKLTQQQAESRARLEKEMEQNDLCVARLEQELKERDKRLAELERKLATSS